MVKGKAEVWHLRPSLVIKFQSITRIILSGHASSIFYREVMSLCEIENIEKSGLSMKY